MAYLLSFAYTLKPAEMKSTTSSLLLFLAAFLIAGCNPKAKENSHAEQESNLVINTFENDSTGIDSLVLRDDNTVVVAIPVDATARRINISDEEFKCLKKCKKADGSYDLDCILLCPVSKRYTFTMASERAVQ